MTSYVPKKMGYRWVLLSLSSLFLGVATARADDYFPPPDTEGGWRTITEPAKVLETTGVDVAKLDQAFEYVSRSSQHGGLLVVRHGYLIYEKYYGKGNREAIPTMASVGKAFTSIACGIMLHEKHDQIPEWIGYQGFHAEVSARSDAAGRPSQGRYHAWPLIVDGGGISWGRDQSRVRELCAIGEAGGGAARAEPGSGHVRIANATLDSARGAGIRMRRVRRTWLRSCCGIWWAWRCRSTSTRNLPSRWASGSGGMERIGATRRFRTRQAAGDVAVWPTDALRFEYLLLHKGKWKDQQLVPAEYVEACGKPNPYQKHAPFSLMFEINADGHVAGAPKDAFFKSGAGGFGVCVIPSLDMVIYKMSGDDPQYDPARTGIPQDYKYDGSRDKWKPASRSQFSDGPIGTDDGLRRVTEMVAAAVSPTK